MKQVYTSIILLIVMLFSAMTIAQEGQKRFINYQGVARNADGTLMNGESMTIGVKLDFGSSGSAFEETHSISTDANGVFSLSIGNGNAVSGEYGNLPWGEFATTATISINGNEIGTTELMAVPHALSSADNQWHTMGDDIENKNGGNVFVTGSLYASKDLSLAEGAVVNEFSTDITLGENSDEIVPTQKAIKTYVDGQLGGGGADDQTAAEVAYDNSTSGLTATTAQTAIDELVSGGVVDADSDPTNEIQTISFDAVSNKISLTDGGEITIPAGGTDADADPNNEIQDISLAGTELTISDGSTIDLAPIVPPGGTDDQNAGEVPYDNTTSGLTATDSQAAIDELASGGLVDTDDQALVLTGDVLTIEDGAGSVDLSAYKDVDVTTKTGILLGDGTAVSGLVGTADGQVAKWNAGTSKWEAGADATGGGGSSLWTDNGGDIYFDSGNVGIGLTNPNAMHQLHSTTAKSFTHFTTDATGKALNDGLSVGVVDDFNSEIMNHEKSLLNFGSYGSTIMTVHYNGRVGIGDDEPESLLDVDGAIRSRDLIGGGNVIADISGNLVIGPGGGGSGTPTGLEAIDEGNGIGWRLIGRDPNDYGNVGENAVDLSYFNELLPNGGATGDYALATGGNTRAIGDWSTSMGRQNSAEGEVSFATGFQNIASGSYSTVMGRETQATGSTSMAINSETSATGDAATSMGFATRAKGRATVSMGINTFADANSSLAIGRFNVGGGDGTNWVATDPVFEIGIGSNIASRANAMTVLKNGDIGIGDATPSAKLDVDGNIRSSDLTGVGERNVVADANGNLIIGTGGGGSSLWSENGSNIHFSGGNVGIGTNSPSAHLHISEPAASGTPQLLLEENGTAFSTLRFKNLGKVASWDIAAKGDDGVPGAANSTLKFRFENDQGSADRMVLTGAGNLGINANNPSERLQVGGTIRSTDLTGAGERNVVADANGNLIIGAGGGGASKIDDLSDGKSEASGSSVFLGLNAGASDNGTNNFSVGVGFEALTASTNATYNAALGYQALSSNTTGAANTSMGSETLVKNKTGGGNTATGRGALFSNISGDDNTAVGISSNFLNDFGDDNTSVGARSLRVLDIGSENTAVGSGSLYNLTNGSNNIGIGFNSEVPNGSGSNQVRIGNTAITYAGVQVAWTVTSDARWKANVRELPYGLDMVGQLRPVDYIRKNNNTEKREIGFIAQEVEHVLSDLGYADQGILTKDDKGFMSLRYNDFIPVLTKAVQELKAENDSLKSQLLILTANVESLNSGLSQLKNKIEILDDHKSMADAVSED